MNKRRENQITHSLKIYNNEIETTKSAKLLGIGIDNDLSFNIYIYIYICSICSKTAMQMF